MIALWGGLSQSAAIACSLGIEITPNDGLRRADVVFAGRVMVGNQKTWPINRIRFKWRPPFIYLAEDLDLHHTTFEVTKVWKGDLTVRSHVIHPLYSGACGYSFQQGEEYIVYASLIEGELNTSLVWPNNKLSLAGRELATLGVGKPPSANPSYASRALIVVVMLLSLLGWAVWLARRRYGVQKL
jgi:hypothetical protein